VARAIASLVLIKDGLFPFVITRDDKPSYLNSLEKADSGDLKPLVDLTAKFQITQFRKASAITEDILVEENTQAALSGLLKAADKIAAEKLQELRGVFDLAEAIESDILSRLQTIAPQVNAALIRASGDGTTFVTRSTADTDYYFRSQIVDNAKRNLHYFADTSEYRAWVALNMKWSRKAQLVFTIHGIGKPFNGSLICAPFLEFKDVDEDGQARTALVPISEEGLVFFYNEERGRLITRMRKWREGVIRIMLRELSQNL
jgi:hypothetical protein